MIVDEPVSIVPNPEVIDPEFNAPVVTILEPPAIGLNTEAIAVPLIVIAYIKECRGLPVSDLKNKFDPEIWTLSLLGDVFGFIDEAFSDIDIKQRDALRLYLEKTTMELGLYEGVKERLLECIWQEKIDRRNTSSLTH